MVGTQIVRSLLHSISSEGFCGNGKSLSQGRADYIVARACDASAGEADAVVATRAAADVDPKLAFPRVAVEG